jgi:serine/threonine-protein kinase
MLDDLIESLRLSHLLEPRQLDVIARDPDLDSGDPEAFVGELRRRAWLTPFQAEWILGGRGFELVVGPYLLLEPLGGDGDGTGQVFLARHWMGKRAAVLKVIAGDRYPQMEELRWSDWLTPFQVERVRGGRANELLIGPYLLLEPLGAGKTGRVFLARHRTAKRDVALKVIRNGLGTPREDLARFRRTIEAIARWTYPSIVTADLLDEADGILYLVMEFVQGVDLAGLIRQRGPLAAAEACDLTRQAALGLQHIHDHGLVHRGIRPSNLFRAECNGVVKILDLGLAWLEGATGKSCGAGTADYLAPEQAANPRDVDIRADIYSLGCSLYYLLAGHPPFPGGTALEKVARHRDGLPVPITALRTDLPPGLATVLGTMMARQPEGRFAVPFAVADALAPFCLPPGPGGPTVREPWTPASPADAARPHRETLSYLDDPPHSHRLGGVGRWFRRPRIASLLRRRGYREKPAGP